MTEWHRKVVCFETHCIAPTPTLPQPDAMVTLSLFGPSPYRSPPLDTRAPLHRCSTSISFNVFQWLVINIVCHKFLIDVVTVTVTATNKSGKLGFISNWVIFWKKKDLLRDTHDCSILYSQLLTKSFEVEILTGDFWIKDKTRQDAGIFDGWQQKAYLESTEKTKNGQSFSPSLSTNLWIHYMEIWSQRFRGKRRAAEYTT